MICYSRSEEYNHGPLKQAVMRHKARLKAELVKYKIKVGAKSDDDLVSQKVKDAGT
jgi:putative methyltransferase